MHNFNACVIDTEILSHITIELFMPHLWNLLGYQTRKFYENDDRSYINPNNKSLTTTTQEVVVAL